VQHSFGRVNVTTVVLITLVSFPMKFSVSCGDDIDLQYRVDPKQTCDVTYQLSIQGKLSTPAADGQSEWDLISSGRFRFRQRRLAPANPGPTGFRAVRQFQDAAATTTVGKDHRTTVQLPVSHRLIHVFGADTTLVHVSPVVRLARKHVDLLQLPCDPIAATALLPTRMLTETSEKWNADAWVVPMLVGLDGVVSQTISCQAVRVTENEAVIQFTGKAEGAVSGAAVDADISGRFTFDREHRVIRDFSATLKEKRSPGVVSPGLVITATVQWTQVLTTDDGSLPREVSVTLPEPSQLLLTVSTPWRLMLLHDRDWHVFHETSDLLMLRLLKNGALIGQCNITPSKSVQPGSFTAEESYRNDVQASIASRGGTVTDSDVTTTPAGWRIHHVRAKSMTVPPEKSKVAAQEVYWDHYLCTWKTGEQYSLVFTHTKSDDASFGDSARKILATLVVRQNPPKLPLPR
jgi:hypothetical protein